MKRRDLGWAAAGVLLVLASRRLLRRARALRLDGRAALVTGGSRGLGLLVAEELGARGARIAIVARDERGLARAEARLRARGVEAWAIRADVRRPEDAPLAVEQAVAAMGRLDVLVNNAGVITVGPLSSLDEDDFADSMATHFWGPLRFARAALPHLRRGGDGRIVNVASIGGRFSVPHLASYSASKAALVALSQSLAAELSGSGVRVTTVCPGLMRTGSHVNARFKGARAKEFGWFAVAASAPLVTVNARRAARKIVRALEEGRPFVTYGVAARMAESVAGVAPGAMTTTLALANRLLPAGSGDGGDAVPGWRCSSRWAPSWLTTLGDRAAHANLELLDPFDP
jgi:NAD(P)-dependent dehydrogenase (short-subunit alcohol dehydrogenase family)